MQHPANDIPARTSLSAFALEMEDDFLVIETQIKALDLMAMGLDVVCPEASGALDTTLRLLRSAHRRISSRLYPSGA